MRKLIVVANQQDIRTREKDVVKIMTMLFDQGYVNEIARKESIAEGVAIGEARG